MKASPVEAQTTATSCDIPSINLKPYFEDKGVVIGESPTPEQLEISKQINDACCEHGFVHVTGFGFSSEMAQRMFDASKDLFDNDKKHEDYLRWSPITNIGFSPYANETLNTNRKPDLKEAFNLRFPPKWSTDMHKLDKMPKSFQSIVKNICENEEESDGEYSNEKSLHSILRLVATRYAMACAVALGLPPTAFSKTLKTNDLCTLRFLHYPPTHSSSDAVEEKNNNNNNNKKDDRKDVAIRAGEHTDYGAFTFLFLGSQGPLGLQVKSVYGGEIGGLAGGENDDDEDQGVRWKDVVIPSSPSNDRGGFGAVVNTGAMLARWTNDYWKATAHRVIIPDETAARQDRYSIAFFVDPDVDQLIEVDDKFKRESASHNFIYEPITSQDFLRMKLQDLASGGAKK